MAQQPVLKIIDAHIHLFAHEHLPQLAWMTPASPLHAAHAAPEYARAVAPITPSSSGNSGVYVTPVPVQVAGYLFVEADRSYSLPLLPPPGSESTISVDADAVTAEAISHPLDEISFAQRIYTAATNNTSGGAGNAGRMLGMIPWAPIPLGAAGMDAWWALAQNCAGDPDPRTVQEMVRGVRFLVQDAPRDTLTAPGFLDGVRWVLRRGLAFDLGIDVRSGGLWQLADAAEFCARLLLPGRGTERGWVVINHMAKPDMHVSPVRGDMRTAAAVAAEEWRTGLAALAAYPNVAIKLSGVFSEIDHAALRRGADGAGKEDDGDEALEERIVLQVLPWAAAVVELFGPERLIWGSDWPVCNLGYGRLVGRESQDGAWRAWARVSARLVDALVARGLLTRLQTEFLWWRVAEVVYGVRLPS